MSVNVCCISFLNLKLVLLAKGEKDWFYSPYTKILYVEKQMLKQYSTCPSSSSNCTAVLIFTKKFLHSCQLLKNEIKLHYPNGSKVSPHNIMVKLPWLPEPQRGGYLKNILNYFTTIFVTKCAKLNYCMCTYEYVEPQ